MTAPDDLRERNENMNDMAYWFPRILAAGLPVPRTTLLHMPSAAQEAAHPGFDGQDCLPPFHDFCSLVANAAEEMGFPCFLRSGRTSAKFEWARTCFIPDKGSVEDHLFSIMYFSECCGMFGELAWDVWAVRELLPTTPVGVCTNHFDMPICREFRFFADETGEQCAHPYWPWDSLGKGHARFDMPFNYDEFCKLPAEEYAELSSLAQKAAAACGGEWSVDFLETKRGWFLTDMALAERSYHWPECERAS